jgi:hypothetical protein
VLRLQNKQARRKPAMQAPHGRISHFCHDFVGLMAPASEFVARVSDSDRAAPQQGS